MRLDLSTGDADEAYLTKYRPLVVVTQTRDKVYCAQLKTTLNVKSSPRNTGEKNRVKHEGVGNNNVESEDLFNGILRCRW
jgi:hypothetical protein